MTQRGRPATNWTVRRPKLKVLGTGPDGRNIYTSDPDARAGHRSATNTRPAGPYVGRELHVAVAVPAIANTDTTNWVKFAPDVPAVIITAALVPAGTHRGDAVREALLGAHRAVLCTDVVADAGYTLMRPETFLWPLRQAGVDVTLQPKSHQRHEGAQVGGARVLHGQLFSRYVPDALAQLQLPGRNTTTAGREASMELFARRAAYRYGRHKAPGADGVTRWVCPFHAGRLRSRQLPWTMRASRTAPLVELGAHERCCDGVLHVGADRLPLMQPTIVGTSAWWQAWGRRNLAETVNSMLHGGFIDIDKNFVRLLNTGRIDGLLAHSLAGYNRWAMRQWDRIHRLLAPTDPDALPPEKANRLPRKERVKRYEDILPMSGAPPGAD
jgi:hypothetical protein